METFGFVSNESGNEGSNLSHLLALCSVLQSRHPIFHKFNYNVWKIEWPDRKTEHKKSDMA